jgi:hypothetical protein
VKIDVRTLDGQRMTWRHATVPLGSALRIAPAFTATATADDTQVRSTIEAVYSAGAGRYQIIATAHQAIKGEITPAVLRQIRLGELLTAAVPHCVAVEFEGKQLSVTELLAAEGRVVPKPLAAIAVAAGPTEDTLGLVQLIYGVAALAAQPPMRAVATELGIPERTATHWITKARRAGLLDGITYAVGRQPDGQSRAE